MCMTMPREFFLLIEDPTVNSRCIIGCIRSILPCLIPRVHLHAFFPFYTCLHISTNVLKSALLLLTSGDWWSRRPVINSLKSLIRVNVSPTVQPYHCFIVDNPHLTEHIMKTMFISTADQREEVNDGTIKKS
jgi:hypothetical protein